jgi:thioredoxin:protein disulfide reductase
MAFTYAGLGVLAATSGFMFGSLLSNSYFLLFLSAILFIAALSMFDIFEIQTPQFLSNRMKTQGRTSSVVALFGAGLFSGLIVGPCVGPVLVSILGYVSQTGSVLLGFGLLFTFAIGLGSLIIVAGTFSSVFENIPRAGSWMVWVKKLIGLAFLALIVYFLAPLLKTRDLTLSALAIGFIFSMILLSKEWKHKTMLPVERALWRAGFALLLTLSLSVASMSHERFERLVGYDGSGFANTHWVLYSDESLKLASDHQDFVVLDFYAEWCAACRELKHKTFSDPRVSGYSGKIKWLYFDSTKSTEELAVLKKKYGILGLPTILFFDAQGKWRQDLTLTGFEDADSFIKRLDQLTGGQK